ncbi:dicarboxylate/amino acid:cation symporter [Lottiidibacillus patelloidae]|uniref:Dicarboxylate/amino acid:cation symporter n=1 Tax=Lottiidibacillus patelloidae TaxID=2670334 RepID=A0A263BSI9_9BACI|nr:dicarboxylate/amino acid:cation symporter [Lottiidibacillus patelloidae]OZM56674.1 dicarboxylate/amino acid:cation symporter [Lottiidibacillus patelloidae]
MSLTKKILLGMFLGIVVGVALNPFPEVFEGINNYILYPLGKIFVNLIKMLVVPIVVVSLILGTAGISDPKKLGRIGFKTIAFFLITTTIALVLAIGIASVIQPGAGDFKLDGATFEGREAPPVIDTLINIIPANPFGAMVEGKMLQIIAFSIFIGFGMARLGEKVNLVLRFVEQLNEVLMYLVQAIMKFAPYGAFALIATAIGSQGIDAISAMGKYMFVVVLVLFIHLVFTYGSAVSLLGKFNPVKFIKGFYPAMIVAFSTSSSSATLPVSMKTAQNNLKVPKSISGFVQPLGATINMDGTAIMQGVATIFIAQVYGVELGLSALLTVVLTATLASIGTAGVPGVGLIMLSMVLTSVGLPVEAIALVLGVDRILDMTRTAVNITGDAACAVIISKSEKA